MAYIVRSFLHTPIGHSISSLATLDFSERSDLIRFRGDLCLSDKRPMRCRRRIFALCCGGPARPYHLDCSHRRAGVLPHGPPRQPPRCTCTRSRVKRLCGCPAYDYGSCLVTDDARQFAYSVVGFHGSGIVTYGEALSAVFLEGYVVILTQNVVNHSDMP